MPVDASSTSVVAVAVASSRPERVHPVVHDRLRDSRDIVAVLRGGRQRAGRLVVLHARPREPVLDERSSGRARVGVLASRRVGQATNRNRAKRLLREAVRHVPLGGDHDVVLVARAACAASSFAEVQREVWDLAEAMGLLVAADHPDRAGRQATGPTSGLGRETHGFEPRRTA